MGVRFWGAKLIGKLLICWLQDISSLQPCQVILAGTAPWLGRLSSSLTPLRKKQLRRVKSFLKLETVRIYTDETGAKRCVRAPSSKLTPITDWIWNMCLCVAVLYTFWNPPSVRPVAKTWKLPRCTLVSLACGLTPQHAKYIFPPCKCMQHDPAKML